MNRLSRRLRLLQNQRTHRLSHLPVLILLPHSACNCRCVMCDIWKANARKIELSPESLRPHLQSIRDLGVQWVVLSGGEPLMHRNLWTFCELLRRMGIRITLLSTGLLLPRHAEAIVRWIDEVTVSLDGSPTIHDAIRNVPGAFRRLQEGVTCLKRQRPALRITARCVIQKRNYFDLPHIIDTARSLTLDQISFLAVDVSSTAFNRPAPWDEARRREVMLTAQETAHFADLLESVIQNYRKDFESRFIAESPQRLRAMVQYFRALLGETSFPPVRCNAPWMSAVLEADGRLRPCFFHPPYGQLDGRPLDRLLNSEQAIAFRRRLDVATDPMCRQCTCSMYVNPLPMPKILRSQKR